MLVTTSDAAESPYLRIHTLGGAVITQPNQNMATEGNFNAGAIDLNDDSSVEEHDAQRVPLISKAVIRKAEHVKGRQGATQSPFRGKEVVKVSPSPILEQIEWPYGGSSSGATALMRRTMPAHQKSMDSIDRPYEHSHRAKRGSAVLNHDISNVEETFKELKPTELPLPGFSQKSSRRG